jgi:hypothetical protein
LADKREVEFFVLRYVPNAVRQEFINIGILMVEVDANRKVLAEVRFAKDWRRLQRLDPEADVDVLEALLREIRAEVGQFRDPTMLLERMEDSFSNVIQLSGPLPVVAETAADIDTLASTFLDERKGGAVSEGSYRDGRRQ